VSNNSPLRVGMPPNDLGDRTRGVLGTIPDMAVPSDTGPGDANNEAEVVVISGSDQNWARTAAEAVAAGASAVVVADPRPTAPAELDRLAVAAEIHHTTVAIDTAFATDPAWIAARDAVAKSAAGAQVIDSVVSVPPGEDGLASALLAQLAVVRPLLGPDVELAVSALAPDHFVLTGAQGETAITLAGIASGSVDEAGMTLDVVGVEEHWQVTFSEAGPARPTAIVRRDSAGQHVNRPRYESGRRASWRAVHGALKGDGGVAYGLIDLQDDLTLAGAISDLEW
jgi:hypothetical protein